MTYDEWKRIEHNVCTFYKNRYQLVYKDFSDEKRFVSAVMRGVTICIFEYNLQVGDTVRVACYLDPLSIQKHTINSSVAPIGRVEVFDTDELKFLDMLGFQLHPTYAHELKNRLEAELERKVSLPRIEDWIYEEDGQ